MLAFASYSPLFLLIVSGAIVATSTILLILLFFFIVTSLKAHREHSVLPGTLPFVGKQSGQLLSSFRANVRGATESGRLFAEAYTKVCSLNSFPHSIILTTFGWTLVLVEPGRLHCSNMDEGPSSSRAIVIDSVAFPAAFTCHECQRLHV